MGRTALHESREKTATKYQERPYDRGARRLRASWGNTTCSRRAMLKHHALIAWRGLPRRPLPRYRLADETVTGFFAGNG